jgi:hypothetical protein
MVQQLTLRPAQPEDFAFCERTYFEPMRATIEELGLDEARHLANFAKRWKVEQVRIVMMCGQIIGWLQTASTDDALFLAQFFIDTRFQRQGIGSRLRRVTRQPPSETHRHPATDCQFVIRKIAQLAYIRADGGRRVERHQAGGAYGRCGAGSTAGTGAGSRFRAFELCNLERRSRCRSAVDSAARDKPCNWKSQPQGASGRHQSHD